MGGNMPPQPLVGKHRVEFGAWALVQRPELALKIAIISAAWNEIDHLLDGFFIRLLHADAVTAAAIYAALRTPNARLDVIAAAGKSNMSAPLSQRFSGELLVRIR